MKTTNNKCILATGFPMVCFIILLLNINLDSSGMYAADSSGTNFLLADNILNNLQPENDIELKLESWMIQPDAYQQADAVNSYNHSMSEDSDLSFESWMSEPEQLTGQVNSDSFSDEVQSEEAISLESWMINTSSWIEVPCEQ